MSQWVMIIFYEQIVNEVQLSFLSLIETLGQVV